MKERYYNVVFDLLEVSKADLSKISALDIVNLERNFRSLDSVEVIDKEETCNLVLEVAKSVGCYNSLVGLKIVRFGGVECILAKLSDGGHLVISSEFKTVLGVIVDIVKGLNA